MVLEEADALDGMVFATQLSWEESLVPLEAGIPGLGSRLEALGLKDGAVTVFLSEVEEGQPVDLTTDGRLMVTAALAFDDEAAAIEALTELRRVAEQHVADVGASTIELPVNEIQGAEGLAVSGSELWSSAAVIAWHRGEILQIAFSQGGNSSVDVQALAIGLIERAENR